VARSGLTLIGVGTDLVEIERFRLAMQRRVSLPERLFSDDERAYAFRHRDPAPRLAAPRKR
jgi:holo-[acyl-carrier protein] synthase